MEEKIKKENGRLPSILSDKEQEQLLILASKGDKKAREELIIHNMRLVSYVANQFYTLQYSQDELINVGVIGLIKAIDNFDVTKHYKLSTLAFICIKNEILYFIRKQRRLSEKCISLELPVNTEMDDVTIADVIKDNKVNVVENYEQKELYMKIRELVNKLPEEERKIMLLYFYSSNENLSFRQIANILGYVPKNVDYIVTKIYKVLREEITCYQSGLECDSIDTYIKKKRKRKK